MIPGLAIASFFEIPVTAAAANHMRRRWPAARTHGRILTRAKRPRIACNLNPPIGASRSSGGANDLGDRRPGSEPAALRFISLNCSIGPENGATQAIWGHPLRQPSDSTSSAERGHTVEVSVRR